MAKNPMNNVSRAKDPQIVKEAQQPLRLLQSGLVALSALSMLLWVRYESFLSGVFDSLASFLFP